MPGKDQHTAVNNVVLVKVIDSLEDLPYRSRSVLFCETAFVADAVEQLSTRG